MVVGGGLFDFRVTPNPNFRLDVNLDVEFDNLAIILTFHFPTSDFVHHKPLQKLYKLTIQFP